MPLRTKAELLTLPEYDLTLTEWAWVYPDRLAPEHFKAVKEALRAGAPVLDKVLESYPSLARRKKHGSK